MNGRNVNVNNINKSTSKIRLFVVCVEGIVTFYENLICTHTHTYTSTHNEIENKRETQNTVTEFIEVIWVKRILFHGTEYLIVMSFLNRTTESALFGFPASQNRKLT